jgi:multidrug efflux pump subunit AcrA (membrane-fusion protein)
LGLLPGISAKVEIQLGRCQDVLAVPSEAVSVDHDRNVCYIIRPSGLERREITPGRSTTNLIEVVDGLKEGESVILNPTQALVGLDSPADSASPGQLDTVPLAALH